MVRLIRYLGMVISRRIRGANLEEAATFIGIAFFWLILFSTLLLITDILGLRVLTSWFESILQYTPNLLAAILIIFAAVILGNFIATLVTNLGDRMGLDYGATLGRIAQSIILFTAIVIAIDQIGIEVNFLINIIDIVLAALLFGAALAFGLGARDSVRNILASFYVRKMYKAGDYIQVGSVKGTIIKIESTHVLLENEAGQMSIPSKSFNQCNSSLLTKKP
jgi:small-conductance mechanosensitive channel